MILEPAPNEHAQLTARLKIMEKLNSLLADLDKRFKRRTAQLVEFATHSGSGIAYTLGREAIIHMGTLNGVTSELTLEFIRYLEAEPLALSAMGHDISVMQHHNVVDDLYRCVELMGVDDSTKFVKLALTILTKGTKVAGLFLPIDAPVVLAEVAEALKDIVETKGVDADEERKSARFLLELEFMMMLSLSAAAYAAAAVHIQTNKKVDPLLDISGNADVAAARAYVIQHMKNVRRIAHADEAQALFEFPEGLWLDTKFVRIKAAAEGAKGS